jgi:transcription antitermination factor NusG
MMEKRVRRRDNNKLRKTVMPLFPGYLAFAAPDEAVEDVYVTRRLSAVLPVEDQAGFAAELAQVQRALEAGSDLERLDRLEPGQPVRVIAGPLLGLEGEVVTARGQTRLIIRVQMFQQAVSLEVDEAFLEKR